MMVMLILMIIRYRSEKQVDDRTDKNSNKVGEGVEMVKGFV